MSTFLISPLLNPLASKSFYEALDFKIITKNKVDYAVSKDFYIELNSNVYVRPGIKMVIPKETLDQLLKSIPNTSIGDDYLMTSPCGCRVYLTSKKANIEAADFTPEKSLLGNFNGLSLESNDLELSIKFWTSIGFKVTNGSVEKGWIGLENEAKFAINIMIYGICPHYFSNPGINFFNGKENPNIIREIKSRNIPIWQEVTYFNPGAPAENLILSDPGGLIAFLFND